MAAIIARSNRRVAVSLYDRERVRSFLVFGRRYFGIPIKGIGGLASIGDVLLGLGCGALFVSWMRTKKKPGDATRRTTPEQPARS